MAAHAAGHQQLASVGIERVHRMPTRGQAKHGRPRHARLPAPGLYAVVIIIIFIFIAMQCDDEAMLRADLGLRIFKLICNSWKRLIQIPNALSYTELCRWW